MNDILNKNRVKLVSLIMMFFVVTIHTNIEYFYSLSKATTMFDKILSNLFNYIQNGICRVAVPYFMFKAGYLYFIDFDGTIDNYKKKCIRRLKTLVIPYILWNFINWLFTYLICIIPFISKYVANREPIPISFTNMLKIIFLREAFLPNWFLQYLIIFSFIIPLFYKYLKKFIGLVIIFINIYIYIY